MEVLAIWIGVAAMVVSVAAMVIVLKKFNSGAIGRLTQKTKIGDTEIDVRQDGIKSVQCHDALSMSKKGVPATGVEGLAMSRGSISPDS